MRKTLTTEHEAQIVAAIKRAEAGNRGEVRVHVEPRCQGASLARARELFAALGMARTAADTGVLLYVAQRSRKTAIWAGQGIHDAVDSRVWQGLVDDVASRFAAGDGIAGLCAAIDSIGDMLRKHLPGPDEAGDELPNKVTTS